MANPTTVAIPTAVTAALDRLKETLAQSAGPNLASLILYGGVARGRYRPGKSDVNIAVVLRDASAEALSAIAPALQAAWRAAGVEAMILTIAELPHAAHAFPTKFLDIKQHHKVLAGEDPFSNLDVPRDLIRLRIAQELQNLLLRLRHRFVSAGNDATALTRILARTAKPFAIELAAMLQWTGKLTPDDDRSAAIFSAAALEFQLDPVALAQLAALRHDQTPAGDAIALFRSVLDSVAHAIDIVARMKESPA